MHAPARRHCLRAFAALPLAALGPRHAAAAGPADRIEAVVLVQGYGTGINNMITVNYRPAVLFRDGRYTRDAARALLADVPIAGRWARAGDGIELTPTGGKPLRVPAKLRARPAARGALLEGRFRNSSGVGSAAMNVPVVAAWSEWRFERDGSVVLGQGAGANAGNTVTASKAQQQARYRIDGHTITLAWTDGRSETLLFYRFPDSDDALGIGAATLSRRR